MTEAHRLTVTEAARNFSDLVNRVYYRGESAILTRNGIPVAYLSPAPPTTRAARELARDWAALPHLEPADAGRFLEELAEARRMLPPAEERWE